MVNKIDIPKLKIDFKKFSDKFELICKKLNIDLVNEEINKIQIEMDNEAFWDDIQKASTLSIKHKQLKTLQNKINKLKINMLDLLFLLEEMPDESEEILQLYNLVENEITSLEIDSLLNGKYDSCNIFLEIHPGAGGVESHDFAQMLLEMYEKYLGKNNVSYAEVDLNKGDVAGIKSVILEIKSDKAYGFFKNETGIHRLIRISPFDSGNRRHTSFASVKVIPIIENEDMQINDSDLKIDTFRSSGAGGQSVNTTDSAVRITHLPTGTVVSCQNERSQIQNKEHALKILKSKLIVLEKESQEKESREVVGELKSNSFGSQKRTYTLHPYKLVKDHISGYETTQAEKVLAGNIEEFLYANLIN